VCFNLVEILPAHPDTMGREFRKYSERSDRLFEMLVDFARDIDWGDIDWEDSEETGGSKCQHQTNIS